MVYDDYLWSSGFNIKDTELKIEASVGNKNFKGYIDRIDERQNKYRIIDYKFSPLEIARIQSKKAVPFLLLQTYIYAELLKSGLKLDDNSISEMEYVSFEDFKERIRISGSGVLEFISIKRKELEIIFEYLDNGDFLPFTIVKENSLPDEIAEYYLSSKRSKTLRFESNNKCRFCPYMDVCPREAKMISY